MTILHAVCAEFHRFWIPHAVRAESELYGLCISGKIILYAKDDLPTIPCRTWS
jgi:hypothetical protein